MTENQEIVSTNETDNRELLLPVAKMNDLVQSMRIFERVKAEMLTANDLYSPKANEGPKIRASGWRKLAMAFGISDEIMREERVLDPSDPTHIMYRFEVRTYTRGSRASVGVGSASSRERKFQHEEHDLRALAHTRAKSRAIRDILGGSDSIAEEEDLTPEPSGPSQRPDPTAPKVVPSQDPERVRNFWEEHVGSAIAERLTINMTADGPEIFLPPPISVSETKKMLAFAWECNYDVSESAQGLKCQRKRT